MDDQLVNPRYLPLTDPRRVGRIRYRQRKGVAIPAIEFLTSGHGSPKKLAAFTALMDQMGAGDLDQGDLVTAP